MTRSEAKAQLIAWGEAARQITSITRRMASIQRSLDAIPAISGGHPEPCTIVHTIGGKPVTEAANAYQPRGSGTSDPTATAALQRDSLSKRLDELTARLDVLEAYYLGVLRAVLELPPKDAQRLHLHYCMGVRPGIDDKQAYYYGLRKAVTAFQQLDSLPEIPELLREKEEP